MTRKMTWTVLCCLLVAAMLLSACAPAAPQAPAAQPTNPPAPTQEELKPVELTWVLDGSGEPRDAAEVVRALNALPQLQAINTKINIIWYDWGSFDQKTQLMFTSGEPCDLVFTSNWANNYVNGAINGNYVALDDLLPKYAPKTWEEVSDVAWTMSKVNGKIYAIPNQQLWYGAWGWQMRKDIADEIGVTLDDVDRYEDLTPVMAKILAAHPEWKYQIVQGGGPFVNGTMGYDAISGGYGWVKQGDTIRTVVNPAELPIMRERIELWREWVKAGYAPQEVVDYATADAARKNGFFPIKLHVSKPGVEGEDKMIYGYDWIAEPFEKPVLSYILPTMTGVCATSKNPERALMFFDLMYSDPEVYNLVANGIEGKHWVWVDKDKKVIGFPEGVDPQNSGYNINVDWMIGNVFISYYKNASQVGAWELTRKINSEAVLPMPGPFIFDPTPVQAEMAALATVDKQFGEPLQAGLIDPDDPTRGINAWVEAQKKAGLEKVLVEVQNQLNDFIGKNPDIFKDK